MGNCVLICVKCPMYSNYIPVFASFFELLLYITRNVNNVRNQVHMTLNIHIISLIRNNYDVSCRKLLSKWVELVSVNDVHMFIVHVFINILKMITQRITSLILFCRRNCLQFFTSWLFCNPTNHAYLYLPLQMVKKHTEAKRVRVCVLIAIHNPTWFVFPI